MIRPVASNQRGAVTSSLSQYHVAERKLDGYILFRVFSHDNAYKPVSKHLGALHPKHHNNVLLYGRIEQELI